jgi:hypothetical protein
MIGLPALLCASDSPVPASGTRLATTAVLDLGTGYLQLWIRSFPVTVSGKFMESGLGEPEVLMANVLV